MILDGNLLAWIEPCDGGFIGAFVGEGAAPDPDARISGRAPATQLCATPDEARSWVEAEAAALDLPVRWVGEGDRAYPFLACNQIAE
ncbi:MAG: hypothetical protein ACJ8AW_06610 [Rhodopila sp.]